VSFFFFFFRSRPCGAQSPLAPGTGSPCSSSDPAVPFRSDSSPALDSTYPKNKQKTNENQNHKTKRLDKPELARIGVHQLRRFLEAVLQRRYLDNVPAMLPLLEREFRHTAQRVQSTKQELSDLEADKLRDKGRQFRESFLTKLSLLLRGTVAAPAERFGETLADEHVRGGAFVGPDGATLSLSGPLANCNMRLYGGAQFHRAMAEFRMAVGQVRGLDRFLFALFVRARAERKSATPNKRRLFSPLPPSFSRPQKHTHTHTPTTPNNTRDCPLARPPARPAALTTTTTNRSSAPTSAARRSSTRAAWTTCTTAPTTPARRA